MRRDIYLICFGMWTMFSTWVAVIFLTPLHLDTHYVAMHQPLITFGFIAPVMVLFMHWRRTI